MERFSDGLGYYVQVVMVDQESDEMKEAKAVMDRIDPDDSEFVASPLNSRLQSGPTTSISSNKSASRWFRGETF